MEFNDDARLVIESRIKEITGRMSLSRKDRQEVEKELRSSFYESSESKARERGALAVTAADVRKAFAEEGAPEEIASCYMKSYAGSLRRAGLLSRTVAFLVDGLVIAGCIAVLVLPIVLLLIAAQGIDQASWIVALVILVNLAIGLVILGVLLCYFVVLEGHFGRTPGKYVMGLQVLREDGTKIGYREALLRNIPKFFEGVIVIDALIMVVFFNKEKQRGFDKVAGTIVVHARD